MSDKLPNDICRCHDALCIYSQTCRRYLGRFDSGNWIVHCASLRKDKDDLSCEKYIPAFTGEQIKDP